mmetsp:Transcript_36429/g.108268  ORF Transcript_36429/g.108268 Transcript_36429/m.108268 type:complete len:223 (+) Transcript_36429:1561-2229(+)
MPARQASAMRSFRRTAEAPKSLSPRTAGPCSTSSSTCDHTVFSTDRGATLNVWFQACIAPQRANMTPASDAGGATAASLFHGSAHASRVHCTNDCSGPASATSGRMKNLASIHDEASRVLLVLRSPSWPSSKILWLRVFSLPESMLLRSNGVRSTMPSQSVRQYSVYQVSLTGRSESGSLCFICSARPRDSSSAAATQGSRSAASWGKRRETFLYPRTQVSL